MQKLIKISNYIYIVDDKAEIKDDMIVACAYTKNQEYFGISRVEEKTDKYPEQYAWCFDKDLSEFNYQFWCAKVIATTNSNLPLPQITNASDDMVGKEIEVIFSCGYVDQDECMIVDLSTKVYYEAIEFLSWTDNKMQCWAEVQPITAQLEYWKANCEEDYINTPISVLKYISELENKILKT